MTTRATLSRAPYPGWVALCCLGRVPSALERGPPGRIARGPPETVTRSRVRASSWRAPAVRQPATVERGPPGRIGRLWAGCPVGECGCLTGPVWSLCVAVVTVRDPNVGSANARSAPPLYTLYNAIRAIQPSEAILKKHDSCEFLAMLKIPVSCEFFANRSAEPAPGDLRDQRRIRNL